MESPTSPFNLASGPADFLGAPVGAAQPRMSFSRVNVKRLSDAILELHVPSAGQSFDGHLPVLHRLIPAEHSLHGVADTRKQTRMTAVTYPEQADLARWLPLDALPWDEQPGSDRRGPRDGDEQLLVRLGVQPGVVHTVGLSRAGPRFSESEQALLRLFGDHLVDVWSKGRQHTAEAIAADHPSQIEILRVSVDGEILKTSSRASRLLAGFFPGDRAGRLPAELQRWVRDVSRATSDQQAMIVTSGERGLELYLAAPAGDELHLYLWERGGAPAPLDRECARLSRLATQWHLTGRQKETLGRLVLGDSNKQIADHLRCAEVTVEMHISAVFRKAGVAGRTRLIAQYFDL